MTPVNDKNDESKVQNVNINSKISKTSSSIEDNNNLQKQSATASSSAEFVSGYLAACTSITVLYPMNKVIFRQIVHGIDFKHAAVQLKNEGFATIYRGLLPPLLQKSTSYSIMFGSQHEYYLLLTKSSKNFNFTRSINENTLNIINNMLAGVFAGLTEAILTPFERVQAVLQLQKFQTSYRHTWHVFENITKTHGLKELYRGGTPICLRNGLSNAIFFSTRQPLKELFPNAKSRLENTIYDFVNGALLGSTISTLFYPVNVVKSHMQARVGGKYYSLYSTFWFVYEQRNRNLIHLFKGVRANYMRAIFSWGITNSTYEYWLAILKSN
jgi:hypothetical protein